MKTIEILSADESREKFQQLQESVNSLTKAINELKMKKTGFVFWDTKTLSSKMGVVNETVLRYIDSRKLKQKAMLKNIEIMKYEKIGRDWIFSVKVG